MTNFVSKHTIHFVSDQGYETPVKSRRNPDGGGLAHSVDLLANGIRRRADLVYNFLDGDAIELQQPPRNGHEGASEHFEAIKGILRERIEGWHAYSGIPLEGQPEAFNAADDAAVEAIDRLSPSGPEAAMAKLVIGKGTNVNNELSQGAFCERLEGEAAAAGLEYFGSRDLYDC